MLNTEANSLLQNVMVGIQKTQTIIGTYSHMYILEP